MRHRGVKRKIGKTKNIGNALKLPKFTAKQNTKNGKLKKIAPTAYQENPRAMAKQTKKRSKKKNNYLY